MMKGKSSLLMMYFTNVNSNGENVVESNLNSMEFIFLEIIKIKLKKHSSKLFFRKECL
jgi:hypothetical protein